jgi:hypothetical protein
MPPQKTWIDLLGKYSPDCKVSGKDIVRVLASNMEGDEYKVLWSFESNGQAVECFEAWMAEAKVKRPYAAALLAQLLVIGRPLGHRKD